jgi:hypothetical protein
MIDIFRGDSVRPSQLRILRDYATYRLGSKFVSLNSGYDAAAYLNEQDLNKTLNIHAYGEISDRCARGETNELIQNLNQLKQGLQITVDFDIGLCPDIINGKFGK